MLISLLFAGLLHPVPQPLGGCLQASAQVPEGLRHHQTAQDPWGPSTTLLTALRLPAGPTGPLLASPGESSDCKPQMQMTQSSAWRGGCVLTYPLFCSLSSAHGNLLSAQADDPRLLPQGRSHHKDLTRGSSYPRPPHHPLLALAVLFRSATHIHAPSPHTHTHIHLPDPHLPARWRCSYIYVQYCLVVFVYVRSLLARGPGLLWQIQLPASVPGTCTAITPHSPTSAASTWRYTQSYLPTHSKMQHGTWAALIAWECVNVQCVCVYVGVWGWD